MQTIVTNIVFDEDFGKNDLLKDRNKALGTIKTLTIYASGMTGVISENIQQERGVTPKISDVKNQLTLLKGAINDKSFLANDTLENIDLALAALTARSRGRG